MLRVLEQTQSTLWNDPGLVQERLTTIAIDAMAPTALELTQDQNEAKELYLAISLSFQLSIANDMVHSCWKWKTLTYNELIVIPPPWSRHVMT